MSDTAPPYDTERSSPAPVVASAGPVGSLVAENPRSTAAPPAEHVKLSQTSMSPATWFQRSVAPAGPSSHVKHSLLAMVPSQPLSRPSSATPPSPAQNMQPPSLPALTQPKLPSPAVAEDAISQLPVPQQAPGAQQQQRSTSAAAPEIAQPATGHACLSQQDSGQQAVNKKRRRERRIQKTAAAMQWQLKRRLADISTDVEMLNHEVARIKCEQSNALVKEDQKDLGEEEHSQLEILRQKRWADLITRQCSTVLKSVQSHKWAFPFARPVDTTIFKDYAVVIAQPIDFATIKAKVDGGKYKQPQQFHDDMKLVFANARRYNPPGSDVNLMANGVEEKFDERWQAVLLPKLAEEDMHARTDEAAVRRQRLDKAQARLAGELEQHRLRLSNAFDSLHSAILDAKSLAAAACKPVPHPHKEALIPALDALTGEQFEWAMSLVHARYPGLPSGPGEEMQFDITCLDSLALRQLMDFTQTCAKAAQSQVFSKVLSIIAQEGAAWTQGTDSNETQVTWPSNPVGVGSRGHKPPPNKKARRSPTPDPSDKPAAMHPSQPHVTQTHQPAQPQLQMPQNLEAEPHLTAAQPTLYASHQTPVTDSKPDQPDSALEQVHSAAAVPAQVHDRLQQATVGPQATAQPAGPQLGSAAPGMLMHAQGIMYGHAPQPASQQAPATAVQVSGGHLTSTHPVPHANAQSQFSADYVSSLQRRVAQPHGNGLASDALLGVGAQVPASVLQPAAANAQHSTQPPAGPVLPEVAPAPAQQAVAASQGGAVSAAQTAADPAQPAAATEAAATLGNMPGFAAGTHDKDIDISTAVERAPVHPPPDAIAGHKRKASEISDTSAEPPESTALPAAVDARQPALSGLEEPLHMRARLEESLAGPASHSLPAHEASGTDQPASRAASHQGHQPQQQQQQPQGAPLQQQAAPGQANAGAKPAAGHQDSPGQQLQQSPPALQPHTVQHPAVAAPRVAQAQPSTTSHAAASLSVQHLKSTAQVSAREASLDQSQQSEENDSEEEEQQPLLTEQGDTGAAALKEKRTRWSAEREGHRDSHQAEDEAESSEDADSVEGEEDDEPEPPPKPMSKLEAYRNRGRRGRGGSNAKQDVRQSQRKPSRSKKSITAADGSGSRGRKSSRGRASTPAARAVSAQKPQRTTSRKTAGKRRRSPS